VRTGIRRLQTQVPLTRGALVRCRFRARAGPASLRERLSLGGDLYSDGTYCAALSSSEVDCWGYGGSGELANGFFNPSATGVQVIDI
jgi:hypothetical protein